MSGRTIYHMLPRTEWQQQAPETPYRPASLAGEGFIHCTGEADRLVTDRSLDRQLAAATTPFDLVYERHALFSSSAMRFARLRGLPGVLEVNAPLVEEQLAHRRLAHPARARSMAREALCAASLRVAVSHGVVDGHRAYGLDRDDFLVCPNGVDPARFAWDIPTARTRETRESFTIGFLGTLKPWHGLDVLLEAFGLLAVRDPAYRLLVVGDGPQRERIESFCAQAGLSGRVELTGAAFGRLVGDLRAALCVLPAIDGGRVLRRGRVVARVFGFAEQVHAQHLGQRLWRQPGHAADDHHDGDQQHQQAAQGATLLAVIPGHGCGGWGGCGRQ